jgi:5-methylcytosine-specific restriction endonuclease McrA
MERKKNDVRESADKMTAKLRADIQDRSSSYREQALKIFPHVCGRCGREFEGKQLKELTVHHIDHNHNNNPRDGSNWELLCIYCHDHEHTRGLQTDRSETEPAERGRPSLVYSPFEKLKGKIKLD